MTLTVKYRKTKTLYVTFDRTFEQADDNGDRARVRRATFVRQKFGWSNEVVLWSKPPVRTSPRTAAMRARCVESTCGYRGWQRLCVMNAASQRGGVA